MQQCSHIVPERRFCPGRVYSRRTHVSSPRQPEVHPGGGAQVVRFRPGFVYSRRRGRGSTTSCSHRGRVANGLQRQLPHTVLEGPPHRASPLKRRKRAVAPARRSVRIAARNWPKGDTQAKARQVLMKRLGILDDKRLSHDDMLLHYFSLFKGPLTDAVVKALTALCGLDAATTTATPQA